MKQQTVLLEPRIYIIICRILGLVFLTLLWLQDKGMDQGAILLVFLTIMAIARWRFNLAGCWAIFDALACFFCMPFWPNAAYGLAFPLFDIGLRGNILLSAPIAIYLLVFSKLSMPLAVVYIQAILLSLMLRHWSLQLKMYLMQSDQQRRSLYELEDLKWELMAAGALASRNAELTERNRIAQDLHDDVGHEITAAVLALQAFEQLWREQDPLAQEIFHQAQQRLNNSAGQLRETVHNMRPNIPLGVDRLKEICDGFTACPIKLMIYGDTLRVPAHSWRILEPCLKEALTNVARHSRATEVEIKLDVNPNIVRLSIYNDGVASKLMKDGIGLRNLRLRARAAGGSLSVDAKEGFQLICVLPIEDDLGGKI